MCKAGLAILIGCVALCGAFGDGKQTILVSPVSSDVLPESEGRLVTDAVIAQVVASGRYSVVSGYGRELALAEIERSESGLFEETAALELGKQTQADLVLKVGIGRVGAERLYATLRLIEVKSGRVVSTGSLEFIDLDRAAERVQFLAAKALELGGTPETPPSSDEFVVLTPSTLTVYESAFASAVQCFDITEARRVATTGVVLGMRSIYGRPFGLFLDAEAFLPVLLWDNGTRQDWLFKPGFPWGTNIHVGPNYLLTLGPATLLGITGGLHEYSAWFWPAWERDKAEAILGSDPFPPLFMTWGVYAGAHLLVRVRPTGFLLMGCTVSYDFLEMIPAMMPPAYKLRGAFAITPVVTYAFGK